MLGRWLSQRIKNRVREREIITERLLSITLNHLGLVPEIFPDSLENLKNQYVVNSKMAHLKLFPGNSLLTRQGLRFFKNFHESRLSECEPKQYIAQYTVCDMVHGQYLNCITDSK